MTVGTCRYFRILAGTFSKNPGTFGYLRPSETVGKWKYLVNGGGETDRERDLPNYSIDYGFKGCGPCGRNIGISVC